MQLRSSSVGSPVQLQLLAMLRLVSAIQLNQSELLPFLRPVKSRCPSLWRLDRCSAALQLGASCSCNLRQWLSVPSSAQLCSSAALQFGVRCDGRCWQCLGLSLQFNYAAPQVFSWESSAVAIHVSILPFRLQLGCAAPQLFSWEPGAVAVAGMASVCLFSSILQPRNS